MVANQAAPTYTVTVTRPAMAQSPAPRARAARRVPVVSITSGKGGVGKTSLAVNLSVMLSARGVRTTLVDADLGLANADVLCGLSPTTRLDSVVQLNGTRARSIRQITVEAPGGFRLVPGAAGVSRMANLPTHERDALVDTLADLEAGSDTVLIDTGAGVSDGVISFVRASDLALCVVTPEPTSITDVYALIKLIRTAPLSLNARSPRIALVVNQVTDEDEAKSVHARLAATCKKFLAFDLPLLGFVRRDDAMTDAIRARGPVAIVDPTARCTRDISTLALALSCDLGLKTQNPNRQRSGESFAQRVLSFLRMS
jgi:flagellar biosynthesis protein FlhG